MTQAIDHVLLTRFNLPTPGVESFIRAQDGWLRDRQQLFERYCLPGVERQSEQNFHWIIYFDTQSPGWLRTRINELNAAGTFVPIYRDAVSKEELLSDIRFATGGKGEVLLTTNLDNDDGLAIDFVHRLQLSVRNAERTALYFTHGLIQQGERLYRRTDPSNAFCSVSEGWESPVTCWADWHNRLGLQMPVQQIGAGPGWLQVVHTGNVSNRVHGSRIDPGRYRRLFSGGLSDVRSPRSTEVLADRLVAMPVRAVQAKARGTVKYLALKVAGKDGLDRLKTTVASRMSARKETDPV